MGVHQDDPEKREEMLLGGLGALQGRGGRRDYIVCRRAYTTVAAAAGGIGIIGIGAYRGTTYFGIGTCIEYYVWVDLLQIVIHSILSSLAGKYLF